MRTNMHLATTRRRQRGIALFVALIAMVILSLAGIALVRSVDTTNSVATNIAFRQASVGPISNAIEVAIYNLFKAPLASRISQGANDLNRSYYATLQPLEKQNGVPAVLSGDYATMSAAYSSAGLSPPVVDGVTLMEVRSVIERICNTAGGVTIGTCDTLPPKVSSAGTDNKYKGIPLPPIPNFRVTVRVDLPNSNTVSHAQAFLR
jgi:type IV pilus assembly protein PilX